MYFLLLLLLLLAVYNQIQSTKNIRKITASMKMVSAAKLKGEEKRLKNAIAFNKWTGQLSAPPSEVEFATFDELPQKCLLVPFTSEKGLCGGVNSFITRATKKCAATLLAQGKSCDIVVIGDKGRGQLNRSSADLIVRAATDVQSPGTYALASALTNELMAAKAAEYDSVVIFYNSYVNAAVYKQMYKVLTPFHFDGADEKLPQYEFEPSEKAEVMEDLYEYYLASELFHSFMDAAASEQSSRMTAMENASKNAGELIDKLTLKYNRARQARITTELIEIISGASALEG
jgi:F-type H+-transporting ATPase subunit gamma